MTKFAFLFLSFSLACSGQTERTFCQSPQYWSSDCYTFKQNGDSSQLGTFIKRMFFDDGQEFFGTGTYIETKKKIILNPYKLVRKITNLSDDELKITPSPSDTTFVTEKIEFYKKGKNLIYYDSSEKEWRKKKENLYLRK